MDELNQKEKELGKEFDLFRLFECKHDEKWIVLVTASWNVVDDGCSNSRQLYYSLNSPDVISACKQCGLRFKFADLEALVSNLEVSSRTNPTRCGRYSDSIETPNVRFPGGGWYSDSDKMTCFPSNFTIDYNTMYDWPSRCFSEYQLTLADLAFYIQKIIWPFFEKTSDKGGLLAGGLRDGGRDRSTTAIEIVFGYLGIPTNETKAISYLEPSIKVVKKPEPESDGQDPMNSHFLQITLKGGNKHLDVLSEKEGSDLGLSFFD